MSDARLRCALRGCGPWPVRVWFRPFVRFQCAFFFSVFTVKYACVPAGGGGCGCCDVASRRGRGRPALRRLDSPLSPAAARAPAGAARRPTSATSFHVPVVARGARLSSLPSVRLRASLSLRVRLPSRGAARHREPARGPGGGHIQRACHASMVQRSPMRHGVCCSRARPTSFQN
jgi:hypothetical protein